MKKEKIEEENAEEKKEILSRDIKKSIGAILLLVFALIFLLSLFGQAGIAGVYIDNILALVLGIGRYIVPVLLAVVGFFYFRRMDSFRYYLVSIGAIIVLVFTLIIAHSFFDLKEMSEAAEEGRGGGYAGMVFSFFLIKYLGKIAAMIISAGGFLIGFILLFNFPLNRALYWLRGMWVRLKSENIFSLNVFKFRNHQGEETEKKEETEETEDNIKVGTIQYAKDSLELEEIENDYDEEDDEINKETEDNLVDIKNDFIQPEKVELKKKNIKQDKKWSMPEDIFKKSFPKAQPKNLQKQAEIIKQTLLDFGIEVEISGFNVGPTVVQYTFKPAVGVKVSRILAYQSDLALSLAANSIRIEAPIPGKSLIGIEVPLFQADRSMVRMGSALGSDIFKNRDSNLSIILGEDVHGDLILGNIEKMPHLLIAGATGKGKSVCIDSILSALLCQNSPDKLKLILVDPKRVGLTVYNGIPHLLAPVFVDAFKVIGALKWAIGEMEKRYKLLQNVGTRDIYSYNEKAKRGKLKQFFDKKIGRYRYEELNEIPFILIVIDELADIMAVHGREVEGAIMRLTQMARAVGIHLIVSTQRPSVDVITGVIKANITTRVAFQVATQIDSRTILDMAGAEKLLGNGDMLYQSVETQKPRRIQGIFVSEQEVKNLVKRIKEKQQLIGKDSLVNEELANSLEEVLEKEPNGVNMARNGGMFSNKDDMIYKQAEQLVIQTQKASTTFLQRKLGVGYPKAANIIDILEANGVVSPPEGSKQRKVLIKADDMKANDDKESGVDRDAIPIP